MCVWGGAHINIFSGGPNPLATALPPAKMKKGFYSPYFIVHKKAGGCDQS